jgi:uncharacterized membrane protein
MALSSDCPTTSNGAVASTDLDWSDEAQFRRDYPLIWLLTLIAPIAITIAILLLIWELYGWSSVWRLVTAAAATFFLFGKFIILGGTEGGMVDGQASFTSEELVCLVLYIDVMVASILAFHIGFLFRLPLVGPRLEGIVEDGRFVLQSNRWMKRAAFLGLVAFVTSPLAASGAIGGSILGRLLGMSRFATWVGTIVGNLLAIAWMYSGGEVIARYIGRDNPALWLGGIAVFVGVIYLFNKRYQHLKAKMRSSIAADSQTP